MITAIRAALRSARFDPRLVLTGSVLLFLTAIGGFGLAQVTANKAERVATPVVAICRANTAASIELTSAGACEAAQQARTAGPYVITSVGAPGEDGRPGAPGTPGGPGTPGTPGEEGRPGAGGAPGTSGGPGADGAPGGDGADGEAGASGEPGAPGLSPPCLDEPGQCRGADGRDGVDGVDGRDGADGADGQDGAPGPSCPSGTSLAPVTFASGESGLGCVSGPAPAETTEPTGAE